MCENAGDCKRVVAVISAQSYIREKYSSTIGLATSILGQVLLGTIKGSGRDKEVIKLCLKDMKSQFSDRVAEDPRTEIEFMKRICNRCHPNFVGFIDAVEDDKLYCMCIEYVSGGDMCTYIQNLGSGIDNRRAKRYAIQLSKAMYFMHRNGYCHLDLSLENVLWDKNGDLLKMCDFGLSRRFPHNDSTAMFPAATIRPGKKGYMAPEIYAYQRFNGEKADVFSLGVIIFILLTGFPPFTTPNASDKCFQYMYYGKLEWLLKQWKLNDIINKECRTLLSQIFCHPKKRIGMKQVLQSEWLLQNIEHIEEEMAQYTMPPQINTDKIVLNTSNIKRKSVPRLIMKVKKKKKKKPKPKVSEIKRGKSKSIACINISMLNESSTTLLNESAATATVSYPNGRKSNGDDGDGANARKSQRRNRSKSLSYSHQHPHHSSFHPSFINETIDDKNTQNNVHLHVTQITTQTRDTSSEGDTQPSDDADHKKETRTELTKLPQTHANMRQVATPQIKLNQTQLITQKCNKNNGNFTPQKKENDNYFDNDRKEGDDETGSSPYSSYEEHHGPVHERHTAVDAIHGSEERSDSITSQDAGSVHCLSDEPQTKATSQQKNNNNAKPKTHDAV